jgi:RNA polymerase sigma-70 factor (ECF subfamily)
MKRHNQRLYRVARGIIGDDPEAEDVVQSTYLHAFVHLSEFRGDARLSTWLTRIAINEALARLRRKRVATAALDDVESTEPLAADAAEGPADVAESRELRMFLASRVRALPFEYRAPLVLRDLAGLSNQEVADVLDLSVAAAKSRIHRARLQVREELERWERRS